MSSREAECCACSTTCWEGCPCADSDRECTKCSMQNSLYGCDNVHRLALLHGFHDTVAERPNIWAAHIHHQSDCDATVDWMLDLFNDSDDEAKPPAECAVRYKNHLDPDLADIVKTLDQEDADAVVGPEDIFDAFDRIDAEDRVKKMRSRHPQLDEILDSRLSKTYY